MTARSHHPIQVERGPSWDRREPPIEVARGAVNPLVNLTEPSLRLPARSRGSPSETAIGPTISDFLENDNRLVDQDLFTTLNRIERHHGGFQILLYLSGHGSASKTEMRRRLRPGQLAIDASLASLVTLGFVACERSDSFPWAQLYALTTRGKSAVDTPISQWSQLSWV